MAAENLRQVAGAAVERDIAVYEERYKRERSPYRYAAVEYKDHI